MKNIAFFVVAVLWSMMIQAQPRPFEPDPSFVPSLEFMQKSWSGEYDGLEPNSKMILSICRNLTLNADFTYTNEVKGHIKDLSDEVLLRLETGTYQYNADSHTVTYVIKADSTLDINILLKGEELNYAVNHYKDEGTEKTSMEDVQFTRAATDDDRQWVLFDQQLKSPMDPRQKAVYVMTGKTPESENYYYVGNLNGWDFLNRDYPFTLQKNDNKWTLTMNTSTDDTFVIIPSTTKSWDDVVYRGQADGSLNGTYTSDIGMGENFFVPSISEMYSYTISIIPETRYYEITINKAPDGIEKIPECGEASSNAYKIYDLKGGIVGSGEDFESAAKKLPPGVYIANGQKIIKL